MIGELLGVGAMLCRASQAVYSEAPRLHTSHACIDLMSSICALQRLCPQGIQVGKVTTSLKKGKDRVYSLPGREAECSVAGRSMTNSIIISCYELGLVRLG